MPKKSKKPAQKRDNPVIAWVFTLNHPKISQQTLLQTLQPFCNYIVIGNEVGESGTPHYQGYLELQKRKRLSTVLALFAPEKPHLEPKLQRSTPFQAAQYCKKDGDFLEFGTPPKETRRSTPKKLENMLKQISEGAPIHDAMVADPATYVRNYRGIQDFTYRLQQKSVKPIRDDFEVILVIGSTGTGKTHFCYETWPGLYRKPLGKGIWFDNYQGEETVLLEEFQGQYPCDLMLQLFDKYSLNVEVKGGHVPLTAKRVVLTTNIHPAFWYNCWENRQEHQKAMMRRINKIIWFQKFAESQLLLDEEKTEFALNPPDSFERPFFPEKRKFTGF